MTIIYVASPYSGTVEERSERYQEVMKYVAWLIKGGHTAFSPIVHSHTLSIEHDTPSNFEFWQNYCLDLIDMCDIIYVLTMDGWQDSVGVQGEIAHATRKNILVKFIDPSDYSEIIK